MWYNLVGTPALNVGALTTRLGEVRSFCSWSNIYLVSGVEFPFEILILICSCCYRPVSYLPEMEIRQPQPNSDSLSGRPPCLDNMAYFTPCTTMFLGCYGKFVSLCNSIRCKFSSFHYVVYQLTSCHLWNHIWRSLGPPIPLFIVCLW